MLQGSALACFNWSRDPLSLVWGDFTARQNFEINCRMNSRLPESAAAATWGGGLILASSESNSAVGCQIW